MTRSTQTRRTFIQASAVAGTVAAVPAIAAEPIVKSKDRLISGGLTNNDIRKFDAVRGLFAEYRERILNHYVSTYGADSKQVRVSRGGKPHSAEKTFGEMLAEQERSPSH